MSRSYKKNPIIKDNNSNKKEQKRDANKAVRRRLKDPEKAVGNGKAYKKIYESWNISDYKVRQTRDEAIKCYNNVVNLDDEHYAFLKKDFLKKYPTLEDWLKNWEKTMIRK